MGTIKKLLFYLPQFYCLALLGFSIDGEILPSEDLIQITTGVNEPEEH
ncbi:hypothetical protein M595_2986 [Lyngbya aestuarii BL J]|uniref:Uncharacterized protein n=1 Tax=Lyngbya aestuarii BL J TaxID=1348334 RepID=U7QGJ7_9CYAN|nr:hypothetical protein M595_2986 [Lyngbya aestuarii BL J]